MKRLNTFFTWNIYLLNLVASWIWVTGIAFDFERNGSDFIGWGFFLLNTSIVFYYGDDFYRTIKELSASLKGTMLGMELIKRKEDSK